MFSWLKRIFKRKKNGTKEASEIVSFEEKQEAWWGNFVVEEEQSRFWKINNIVLCLDRYNREWHIANYKDTQLIQNTNTPIPKEKFRFKTFTSRKDYNEIIIKPTLPDRAILSQLERPIALPAGEEILLFISSPCWIKIEVGNNIILDEIPSKILSDTWAGKNTLEGELCYASPNHCSPRLEEITMDESRVLTPILIINRSKEYLLLNELRIPLPFLSIYSDPLNYLWTEQVSIYYEGDTHPSSTIVTKPHKLLKALTLITPPRLGSKSRTKLKNLLNPFSRKT